MQVRYISPAAAAPSTPFYSYISISSDGLLDFLPFRNCFRGGGYGNVELFLPKLTMLRQIQKFCFAENRTKMGFSLWSQCQSGKLPNFYSLNMIKTQTGWFGTIHRNNLANRHKLRRHVLLAWHLKKVICPQWHFVYVFPLSFFIFVVTLSTSVQGDAAGQVEQVSSDILSLQISSYLLEYGTYSSINMWQNTIPPLTCHQTL